MVNMRRSKKPSVHCIVRPHIGHLASGMLLILIDNFIRLNLGFELKVIKISFNHAVDCEVMVVQGEQFVNLSESDFVFFCEAKAPGAWSLFGITYSFWGWLGRGLHA